jgi:hypothetical protein
VIVSTVLCCSGKYHIEEERVGYKVSMLLQIRNFGEEDAGVYMCTSTNSLGKIEGSIRLYQIGTVQTQSDIMIVRFFSSHFKGFACCGDTIGS